MEKSLTDYVNELKIKKLEKEMISNEINAAKSLEDIKVILKKYLL